MPSLVGKRVMLVANYAYSLALFRSEVIKELRSQGAQVTVVCGEDAHVSKLKQLGVSVRLIGKQTNSLNPLRNVALVWRLLIALHQEKPQIVQAYTLKPVLFIPLLARLLRLKVYCVSMITGLGNLHVREGIGYSILRRMVHGFLRLSFKCTNRVICVNEDDQSFLMNLGISSGRVLMLPGAGVDVARFYSLRSCKLRGNSDSGPYKFLFVGRFIQEKGVCELYEAFRAVSEQVGNVHLYVAGSVSSADSATKDVYQKMNRRDDVSILGHVDGIEDLFCHSDCLILPSYREGMPTVLLEAVTAGIPYIAFDVPGCRDIWEQYGYGILVPKINTLLLAKEMSRAANRRWRFSDGGVPLEKLSSIDRSQVVQQWMSIYSASET